MVRAIDSISYDKDINGAKYKSPHAVPGEAPAVRCVITRTQNVAKTNFLTAIQ